MMTKREFNEQFRKNKNIGMRSNFGTSKWLESQILKTIHEARAIVRENLEKDGFFIVDEKWDEMWLKLAEGVRENQCISEYPWTPEYVWAETEWMEAEELEKDGIVMKIPDDGIPIWERVHNLIDKFNEHVIRDWGKESMHHLYHYDFIPKKIRNVRLNKEQFRTWMTGLETGFVDENERYKASLCADLLWDLRRD